MKRVLVTPLDWGLGHATRCVPVIRELQAQRCEVLIAGSGNSLALLRKEFPSLAWFVIPGYDPHYPSQRSMVWAMIRQLPRFLSVIRKEHQAISNLIAGENIELLISDNRYGCWSSQIPSVLITHQSNIMMPMRFGWMQGWVRRLNFRMMKKFTSCWIPDLPGDRSLAGDLISFGKFDPGIDVSYIGALSRFATKDVSKKLYDVVAVFSGPEPQRNMLENIVVPQLQNSSLSYLVVRGLPAAITPHADTRIVNFLASAELQDVMDAAGLVIARSGYSTVMDMMALGKKVIFIPTPGQTEQEYLAKRLMDKKIAFSMDQNKFNLLDAVRQSRGFSGFSPTSENNYLRQVIAKYLDAPLPN